MSAIGTVAAGVAHEARNPLFGITSTLDALESNFPTRGELQPFVQKLRQEIDRLGRLMSDLLQYGKPSLSERVSLPLIDVLARAIAHCEPMAVRAGVIVHADFYRVSMPNVMIDRERMTRVFQNLLENAIEHSVKGTAVRLSASVGYAAGTPWVEIRVSDRGEGFKTMDLPRVFEPFFTRRHGGTGLGLSIVERIVREHDGMVAAANGVDGGAVVSVRLPAVSNR
jgi:signal transduction histidine kinase